jgi:hypothetical protein
MNDDELFLRIDTQTLTAQGGYGYWFYDDPMGNTNATHHILSRPPGDRIAIKTTPQHRISTSAAAVHEYLYTNIVPIIHNNCTYHYIGPPTIHDPLTCWEIHAGVAAAAFCDTYNDAGCIGFFTATAPHRLVHFIPTPGETNPSAEIVISRPAELWVLERWAEPQSRLLYYGPQKTRDE